jgi:hypothetical protein
MLDAVKSAARNNAGWCDTVCRTHGIVGAFTLDQWTSPVRTPPRYPDAITLTRGVPGPTLLATVDRASPGCSVKDSFADVDLTPFGFEVLFDAEWIRYAPTERAGWPNENPGFSVMSTPELLARWEEASGSDGLTRMFLPSLLERDDVLVFGSFVDGELTAGFVANRSAGCVGISNTFALDEHLDWTACTSAVAGIWPDRPIVGYESGPELAASLGQGFVSLGPLRVWIS